MMFSSLWLKKIKLKLVFFLLLKTIFFSEYSYSNSNCWLNQPAPESHLKKNIYTTASSYSFDASVEKVSYYINDKFLCERKSTQSKVNSKGGQHFNCSYKTPNKDAVNTIIAIITGKDGATREISRIFYTGAGSSLEVPIHYAVNQPSSGITYPPKFYTTLSSFTHNSSIEKVNFSVNGEEICEVTKKNAKDNGRGGQYFNCSYQTPSTPGNYQLQALAIGADGKKLVINRNFIVAAENVGEPDDPAVGAPIHKGLATIFDSVTPSKPVHTETPVTIGMKFKGAELEKDYRVFLHVVDESGRIRFNLDHYPSVSTSQWQAGRTYEYTREFVMPAGTPSGTYELRAGLFERTAGFPKVILNTDGNVEELIAGYYTVGQLNVEASDWDLVELADITPETGIPEVITDTQTPAAPEGYELFFADEFNNISGGLPNPSFWDYRVTYTINGEKQCYRDARRANTRVETRNIEGELNGYLVLEARKELNNCPQSNNRIYQYTSGAITSRMRHWGAFLVDMPHGRYEVRAKIPEGRGTWPAIWLRGEGPMGGWPNSGEIDIMEAVGYEEGRGVYKFHSNLHRNKKFGWPNNWGGTGQGMTFKLNEKPSERFHTWVMEWTPSSIEFFIDDVRITDLIVAGDKAKKVQGFSRDNFNGGDDPLAWPFSREVAGTKFQFILNLAIGGSWGGREGIDDTIFNGETPVEFLIDYVRVYKKRN